MFCQKSEVKKKAHEVLISNRRQGYSPRLKKDYFYTCPSPGTYHFQWFWDSCFHAIVLSHFDPSWAKKELLSLVSVQETNGFCPHVIFWQRGKFKDLFWKSLQSKELIHALYTSLIQPPVLALATLKVFEKDKDYKFLKEILPKIKKYYSWLLDNRDPDKDNLISIISPFESGLDFSPAYDPVFGFSGTNFWRLVMKARLGDFKNLLLGYNNEKIFARGGFNVEDVLVNSVLAQGLWALSELCLAGQEKEESEKFSLLAGRVEEVILKKCLAGNGAFYNLYSGEEKQSKVLTVISLMPLILKTLSDESAQRLVKHHLLNPEEFYLPYPVPSVAKNEPAFQPGQGLLWRGPTWLNINWFLVQGLLRHGFSESAQEIVEKSCFLIQKEGFREYYNPLTGEGYGAENFGWSTLIVDMIELVKNGKTKATNSY